MSGNSGADSIEPACPGKTLNLRGAALLACSRWSCLGEAACVCHPPSPAVPLLRPFARPCHCSTKCSERTVLRAYHTLCAACGERKGFCCKCQGPIDAELTPKDGGAARAAGEEEGGDDVKGDAAAHDLEAETAPESGAGAAAAAAASSGASEAMLPTGGYATKPQAIQDAEAELEDLYASSCGLRERKRRSRIRVLERQLGQREEAASYAADAIAEEDAATVDEADGGPDGDAEEGDAEEGEGEEAAGAEADEADEGEASAAGGPSE